MPRKKPRNRARTINNSFRIVGGRWRGRRLSFPSKTRIRPTPDRVRETLFNWLQPFVAGAHCLDLFAGSGALGIEALSRGARHTVFVEQERASARRIGEHLELLDAAGRVVFGDAFDFLQGNADTFDLVFLDPPFNEQLLLPALEALERYAALKDNGRVYLESAPGELLPALPPGFELTRSGRAGKVEFGLAQRQAAVVSD